MIVITSGAGELGSRIVENLLRRISVVHSGVSVRNPAWTATSLNSVCACGEGASPARDSLSSPSKGRRRSSLSRRTTRVTMRDHPGKRA